LRIRRGAKCRETPAESRAARRAAAWRRVDFGVTAVAPESHTVARKKPARGRPRNPNKPTHRVTVRLTAEERGRLDAFCEGERPKLSAAAACRRAVLEMLEREGR
jgi:hypothetical protein